MTTYIRISSNVSKPIETLPYLNNKNYIYRFQYVFFSISSFKELLPFSIQNNLKYYSSRPYVLFEPLYRTTKEGVEVSKDLQFPLFE